MKGNSIAVIIGSILIEQEGKRFYSFSNADGKCWIMPKRNMAIAMNLYQPSGIKGKLMKMLFPYFYFIKPIRQKLGVTIHKYSLCNSLKTLLQKQFGTKNIEFSIFCGTPSVHQKITMQVSNGDKILGYCKFSANPEIKKIFKHEKFTLDSFYEIGINNIPECLCCDTIKNDIDVFIQTTLKTKRSKVPHQWLPEHNSFLEKLREKTTQKCLFETTDFCDTLLQLKENLHLLSDYEIEPVEKLLNNILNEQQGKKVEYSAYHADFTPWNMFVEKNEVFVFDWEYAQMTYPPYLDYFHFFTQTAIFEKHWDEKQIYEAYSLSQKKEYINDKQYCYYLLDIINRFTIREHGNFQGDIAHCMRIWIRLLSFLTK